MTKLFKIILLFLLISNVAVSQEICNNGIDDDADGLIDLNDNDCDCAASSSTWNPNSFILNGDFENYTNCPPSQGFGGICANWYDFNTADYYNANCGLGLYFEPDIGKHSGNGYAGFYDVTFNHPNPALQDEFKEYVGTCLSQPLMPGNNYKLTLKFGIGKGSYQNEYVKKTLPNASLGIYGSANCTDTLPKGFRGCPSNISPTTFIEIASKYIIGKSEWVVVELQFTVPTQINQLLIGPSCARMDSNKRTQYNFVDSIVLLEENIDTASYQINKTGNYCGNNYQINVNSNTDDSIQWYKNGIALVGNTTSTLSIDTSEIGNYTCVVTNSKSTCYKTNVIVIESQNKNCNEINFFLPNAFTPNSDNLNEVFIPTYYGNILLEKYSFQIFNRWGQILFETNNSTEGWNGTYKGLMSKTGVYVYKYQFLDPVTSIIQEKTGHFTLIR